MSFPYYVPIHVHTDFSLGDALLDVDDYVGWAKENNYPAIAVTDHGNLSASLYFNQVATKAGIKSLIGIEAYCTFRKEFDSEDKDEKRERDHFILLAKNYQGYLDLCWLLGQSMRNSFYYKPIILYEDLIQYNKNLIVSTACMGGRVPKLIMENKEKEAIEFINLMKKTFGDDFYLEMMEVQMAEQTAFNQWAIRNYKRLGLKLIWTTDTHYFKPEHVEAHDAMKLINSKASFQDEGWQKRVYKSRNLWLKKREDIIEEAKALNYDLDVVNEALDNTIEIEQKIEKIKLTRAPEVIMPKFSDNSYEILENKVMDELVRRGWDKRPGYLERVKTELEVIKFKRMEDYFLIVADIVNYAENNDVMCGCGRGCFLPGSKVRLANKELKNIEEITEQEIIISGSQNKREVLEVYKYDIEEVVTKITLVTGETLGNGCTLDHLVKVIENSTEKETFIPAGKILPGDYLFDVDSGVLVKVQKTENFLYKGPVYDLNVDIDHTYNINGYAVHNSGAGSLVVCLLGITKIDPIKYDLYFERFLNVKRLDPPDIDLDFDSKTRYKIEIYLKEKYGINAVSHVISFGTFGIKNSIKDVFRVYFGTDKKDSIDRLSKCLEDDEDDFDEALKKMVSLEGKWAEDFIAEHKKQFDISRVLVGKIRHYSKHAGGVIIAPDSLEKFIPIMRIGDDITTGYPEGGDTRLITDAGLMKFDLLGLNACTIINGTLKQLPGLTVSSITENDSDPKVLEQFNKANTFTIFQFEGKNITKFVKRAKPTKFVDLVSINALYRPAVIQAGGLDMYLKNKENYDYEKAKSDPFERVLQDSYGLMCFQESSMRVFQELGGFSLAEADESRHVFKLLFKGKSDHTDFDHMMAKFREGCHKNTNYDDKRIEEIMETMKSFSKYSFNKCISGSSKILVFKKDSFEICKIEISELFEKQNEFTRIALYEQNLKRIIAANIKEVVKTGIKETYTVKIGLSEIRATLDHKFFTENGWKVLRDITIKDKILVNDSIKSFSFLEIESVEKFGLEETYDIHVDHPDHNYIANHFVVHNSHSCAYAMMAYIMMYLRTYHPTQYFASLLSNTDNAESVQDGKKINLFQHYAMTIQKDYGIKIHKPDVNTSGADFFRVAEDGGLMYALGHIKDVGGKAAADIQEKQPFTSFRDFLTRVTRRIVNKRVIKALIYAEALKFGDTQQVFEKEFKEKIDEVSFLQMQFAHTGLVVSKDLKQATDKEYSLKGVEKAAAEGKYLTRKEAIPITVFISKYRRLAGNSKKTGKPYIMYFATLYDGSATIGDCMLNDAEKLGLEEGDLVKGKIYFTEAKNKKYSEHAFYLDNIQKIYNTEKYDGFAKYQDKEEIKESIQEEKMEVIKEPIKVEEKPKFISRKRLVIEQIEMPLEIKKQEPEPKQEVPVNKPKFISRRKIKTEQLELNLEVQKKEVIIKNKPKFISRKKIN